MKVHESVLGGQSFELVGSCAEVVTSLLLEVLRDLLSEALVSVKTGADGGTTLSDLIDIL